jgi:hypothetical protein
MPPKKAFIHNETVFPEPPFPSFFYRATKRNRREGGAVSKNILPPSEREAGVHDLKRSDGARDEYRQDTQVRRAKPPSKAAKKRTRNMKNRILAIPAAAAAIPANPKIAAIIATTKKASAHRNIAVLLYGFASDIGHVPAREVLGDVACTINTESLVFSRHPVPLGGTV